MDAHNRRARSAAAAAALLFHKPQHTAGEETKTPNETTYCTVNLAFIRQLCDC